MYSTEAEGEGSDYAIKCAKTILSTCAVTIPGEGEGYWGR